MLCSISVFFVVVVSVVRISFPVDLWFWSESTILTNILKLKNGVPVFGPIENVNSFVYSPALEYINYAILHNFDLELSVTANRSLVFCYGIAAACMLSASLQMATPKDMRFQEKMIAFCLIYLAVAQGMMADVLHPDNLALLAIATTFAITLRAMRSGGFVLALGSVVIGACSIWVKQTTGLLGIAAVISLMYSQKFGVFEKAIFCIAGIMSTVFFIYTLLMIPYAKFYLYDLLLSQRMQWEKLYDFRVDLIGSPFWMIVAATGLASFFVLRLEQEWVSTYFVFFFLACAPGISAYLKSMGSINNLVSMQVFFVVAAIPLVVALLRCAARQTSGAVVVAIALLTPLKTIPTEAMYKYASQLESAVSNGGRNRRVLLAHGTVPLIKSGFTNVPLDRANSFLELEVGGHAAEAGTRKRIESGYYDRIVLNNPWFGSEIVDVVRSRYKQVDSIPSVLHRSGFLRGLQGLFFVTTVYDRK